jgi:hypothetical protein
MRRIFILIAVVAGGTFSAASHASAQAQGQLPFANVQPSPTVSPYLNLTNQAVNGHPAYQTLVQPILQQQQQAAQQQAQISKLQRQQSHFGAARGLTAPSTRGISSEIRGTGHVTAFMDYSHFYTKPQAHQ